MRHTAKSKWSASSYFPCKTKSSRLRAQRTLYEDRDQPTNHPCQQCTMLDGSCDHHTQPSTQPIPRESFKANFKTSRRRHSAVPNGGAKQLSPDRCPDTCHVHQRQETPGRTPEPVLLRESPGRQGWWRDSNVGRRHISPWCPTLALGRGLHPACPVQQKHLRA